jgi:hypothetical protein
MDDKPTDSKTTVQVTVTVYGSVTIITKPPRYGPLTVEDLGNRARVDELRGAITHEEADDRVKNMRLVRKLRLARLRQERHGAT